jgi:phospholipid transport system substrate-binding protein
MRTHNKLKIHKILITFFVVLLSWLSVNSYAASDPVGLLQRVADNMIAGLKTNKATLKTKPEVVYNLAYRYVVPHADLSEMSKRVLPPQVWKNSTPAQRKQFEKEFTKTVIRTYASALTNYQDQTVKFYPVRGGVNGNTVEVNGAIISSQNQPIHVTYRLVRAGDNWKLYNMSVEGVDMLDSFRAQFSDILSAGNMNILLQRLAGHNKR